ncbi:MAG: hypothetical protein JNK75_12620 [Betaproteobacteria bacterium]|nr:hypothetical protein [Betaproteobacteria bacterium]
MARTAPLRFLWIAAAMALLPLAGVAAFNYRIDPFQQYRAPAAGQARYVRALQRYIAPGIAKHAAYDVVISGSSIMENYSLAEAGARCGGRAVNLALAAMSAYEQRRILEVALRSQPVRRVVMSIDFNSFAAPLDGSLPDISAPLPEYLYDEARWNDFRYLLNGSVTMHALAIARGAPKGSFGTDPDRAWNWVHEVSFSAARALKDIDPAHINRRFRQGPRTLAHMQASFEANYAALMGAHPDTEFNLVFPPYSIMVWADFAQRKQLEVSLAFKRHVLERTRAMPNVRWFDLQSEAAITHRFDRYSDIYHFDPAVNLALLDAACGNDARYRLTPDSLPGFEAALRAQLAAFDPAAAVTAARAAH